MLIVYGSRMCKDCVACLADFDRLGVLYEYRDFSDNIAWLKAFLAIRDTNPIFEYAKKEGFIGIPCIVSEVGRVSLDWAEFMDM